MLNLSRPELVREIHRGYFEAGADMVETNTFGGSPITLGEFDLQDRTFEINQTRRRARTRSRRELLPMAGIAMSSAASAPARSCRASAISPMTRWKRRSPSRCRGLIAGGVDAILIETCQDTLQIKAAVNGAKIAGAEAGTDTPIFVQVTVETTGTLLVGPDIAAAATVIDALDVPLMGLNCATGPQEMAEHIRWLATNWRGLISVQPNAGLPELVDGQTHYPLGAEEMASWVERYIAEDGLNLIGGCCGTSTPHIAALDAMLRRRAGLPPPPGAGRAQAGLGALRRRPLRPGLAAPGEQLFLHRRALQRQRLEEMAPAAGSA